MTRARWAWLGAIVLGVGLRVARYLEFRGFWGDEAFLIVNVLRLPLRQLLHGPLNAVPASQVSPPVFSLALRELAMTWGPTEVAMRLVPLVASVGTMVIMAWVFRRAADKGAERGAAGITLLWAIAEPLIYQAATVKQYSTDALCSAIVVAILFSGGSVARRAAAIAIFAAIGGWCSMPLIFVVLGVMVGLAVEARRDRGAGAVVAWMAVPAASFIAMYFISARGMAAPDLARFWADAFPQWGHPKQAAGWPFVKLFALFNYPFKPMGFALIVPAAWALICPRVRGGSPGCTPRVPSSPNTLALVLPVAIAMGAAVIGKYPFEGARTTIYLLPAIFALCAVGLARMGRWAGAVVAVAAVGAAMSFAGEIRHPFATRVTRPALEFLWQHRGPDEPVLVTPTSGAIVETYWWGHDASGVNFYPGPAAARPEGSFWVVGCYDPFDKIKDKDPAFLEALGAWDAASSAAGRGWLARHYLAANPTGGVGVTGSGQ